ncbi:MAG: hypothetical protein ACTSPB_04570 [Candidatus Thorarchaeota archaeon]
MDEKQIILICVVVSVASLTIFQLIESSGVTAMATKKSSGTGGFAISAGDIKEEIPIGEEKTLDFYVRSSYDFPIDVTYTIDGNLSQVAGLRTNELYQDVWTPVHIDVYSDEPGIYSGTAVINLGVIGNKAFQSGGKYGMGMNILMKVTKDITVIFV